jgi:hypothetical protein
MATADDGGRDGRRRKYVDQPEKYRVADPALFDEMRRLLEAPRPSIAAVEDAEILPGALFFRKLLGDSLAERRQYFQQLWRKLPEGSIIFFDPDNGLEIKSTPMGHKGSSKFLYLGELKIAGLESRSVIVYQHFGRVERTAYIDVQLRRMRSALPQHDLFALAGTHIAFLVASTPVTSSAVRAAVDTLRARWPGLQAVDLASRSQVLMG